MHKFTKKILLVFILAFAIVFSAEAQYYTKSKKAIKYYKKARMAYREYDYLTAEEFLDKAIKKDENFIDAYYLKADIFDVFSDYEEKNKCLEKAVSIDPFYNPKVYLFLASSRLRLGKYYEARKAIQEMKKIDTAGIFSFKTELALKEIEYCISLIENPVKFNPVNLGKKINTKYDDYFPVITLDEKRLIFTSLVPKEGIIEPQKRDDFQEDFMESIKSDSGTWQASYNLGKPINTSENEGAQALSPDGRILFFTSCDNISGMNMHGASYGSCDIFFSIKQGEKWSRPRNMGRPVNSRYWESQPSYSSDGRTLYFTSNRPGGYGKTDIWKSVMNDDGTWGKPVNLGHNINTSDSESSPYIHPDNHTLYFSSDGHPGMGSADLYISRKDTAGEWSILENMGYPINTHKREFGIIINSSGNTAFISANYKDSNGGLDIYSFELDERKRPTKVNYIKGIVYDSITKKRLGADFELIELSKNELSAASFADPVTGSFMVGLPTGKDYALNISKEGYMFYSENFSLKNLPDSVFSYHTNIPLLPIQRGQKIILKNIFFETDSFALKKESFPELNKLYDFMLKNKAVRIEISGHTDNTGKFDYNMSLSGNRAHSVYEYLVKKGIPEKRMTFKGYGSTKPVAENDTEKGKALNRRTEILIK